MNNNDNSLFSARDHFWMHEALRLADEAQAAGEVPVGAVVVYHDELIAVGHNKPIMHHDPSAHAEMDAMRLAAKKMGNYRLVDTTLYVTLEPCVMCAGAMVHARIKRLVFGAYDLRAGAVVSCAQVLDKPFFNHKVQYAGGLLAEDCAVRLRDFFRDRRK